MTCHSGWQDCTPSNNTNHEELDLKLTELGSSSKLLRLAAGELDKETGATSSNYKRKRTEMGPPPSSLKWLRLEIAMRAQVAEKSSNKMPMRAKSWYCKERAPRWGRRPAHRRSCGWQSLLTT